jgi:DNA-binding IclR family transcriptional regulator
LVGENLLQQDERRRYFLGIVAFELGLSAAPRFNLRDLCVASLDRLASKTGDMAFLTVRSGSEAVCLDRKEGDYPIRTHTFEIGARRPLGIGAGSLAILSALPAEEIRRIVSANAGRLKAYSGLTEENLLVQVEQAQKLGYTVREGSVSGARAIGTPIRNRFGEPFAALSISAISSRMSENRHPELIALLRTEVKAVEKRLSQESV